jgi:hypothetical protein
VVKHDWTKARGTARCRRCDLQRVWVKTSYGWRHLFVTQDGERHRKRPPCLADQQMAFKWFEEGRDYEIDLQRRRAALLQKG